MLIDMNVEKLRKALENLENDLKTSKMTASLLEADVEKLDGEIRDLTVRRNGVQVKLDTEKSNIEFLTTKVVRARKELQEAMSDENFHSSLLALVGDFLESLPPVELQAISESLSSFRPVKSVAKAETESDDLPWSDSGVDAIETSKPKVPAIVLKSLDDAKVQYDETDVRLSLENFSVAGSFFLELKDNGGDFKKFVSKMHLGGKEYVVPLSVLRPKNVRTHRGVKSAIETVRGVYTFGFINWLNEQGCDMSAESVLDYIIGCIYKVEDGNIIPQWPETKGQPVWYRLVSADGTVIKQSPLSTEPSAAYLMYEDVEHNKIIAAKVGCTTAPLVVGSVYKQYTGGAKRNYRMDKCKGIEFSDVFAGAYMTFEEV